MCARLIDGVPCQYPATLIHHRRSPREDSELMFEPSNCVGLCVNHHHGHPGDRPDDVFADPIVDD